MPKSASATKKSTKSKTPTKTKKATSEKKPRKPREPLKDVPVSKADYEKLKPKMKWSHAEPKEDETAIQAWQAFAKANRDIVAQHKFAGEEITQSGQIMKVLSKLRKMYLGLPIDDKKSPAKKSAEKKSPAKKTTAKKASASKTKGRASASKEKSSRDEESEEEESEDESGSEQEQEESEDESGSEEMSD